MLERGRLHSGRVGEAIGDIGSSEGGVGETERASAVDAYVAGIIGGTVPCRDEEQIVRREGLGGQVIRASERRCGDGDETGRIAV